MLRGALTPREGEMLVSKLGGQRGVFHTIQGRPAVVLVAGLEHTVIPYRDDDWSAIPEAQLTSLQVAEAAYDAVRATRKYVGGIRRLDPWENLHERQRISFARSGADALPYASERERKLWVAVTDALNHA
jgi:hypothetical protein